MQIERSDRGEVTILAPSGSIVGGLAGEDQERLDDVVAAAIAAGRRAFVIDLERVPWADSIGIGELIAARNAVAAAGGQLRLCRLSDQIEVTFTITGLDRIFDVRDDVESAVTELAGQ